MAAMAVMAAMADVETARRRCDQTFSVKNSQQKSWAKRTTSFFGFDEIKINAPMLSTIDLL